MDVIFQEVEGGVTFRYDFEHVIVTACGKNGFRVRAAYGHEPSAQAWAIQNDRTHPHIDVERTPSGVVLKNGDIEARISPYGHLSFLRKGKVVLREFMRAGVTHEMQYHSPLRIMPRVFRPLAGGRCGVTMAFESDPSEKIYGMGQYQHPFLNLKGMELELAHRNSQASVPFYVSSELYGFLWNNPSTGTVFFGKEKTEWRADVSEGIDYFICVGDSFKELLTRYAEATGFPPQFPAYASGFWQCKLRYETQEELLNVAREYKRRNLPLSVLVIDFFHWKHQGDWSFDERYWPDPAGMVKELRELGVEPVVSIWPTVERGSVNYEPMMQRGLLANVVHGKRTQMEFMADTVFVDVTNAEAREYFFQCAKRNYYTYGIKSFWLDEAEPEFLDYDYGNYLYAQGLASEVGNSYPVRYSETFWEGLQHCGEHAILNLVRCAWAGSQKYGVLVWSGDVNSSFESMRSQLQAGLNIGMAGIPWWTTDIGGFWGGDPGDRKFIELLIRWLEWGTFCPVMRLHGDRAPKKTPLDGHTVASGADNEVWSFGEDAYAIFVKYLGIRETLRPYIMRVAAEATEKGYPMMRTMFFEFDDPRCFACEDQYMLGSDLLVAPVMEAGAAERAVYLPAGADWVDVWSGKSLTGGQTVCCPAPIDRIPLYARKGSEAEALFKTAELCK